jgi:thymidylate kinase
VSTHKGDVQIVISAGLGQGKSTLAHNIGRVLESAGIPVEVHDEPLTPAAKKRAAGYEALHNLACHLELNGNKVIVTTTNLSGDMGKRVSRAIKNKDRSAQSQTIGWFNVIRSSRKTKNDS